jgi:hypothetical protein
MRWWVRALITIGEVVVEGGCCRLSALVLLGSRSWVLVVVGHGRGPLLLFVRHAAGCSLVVVRCCCYIDNEGRLMSSFRLVATSLSATWYWDFKSVDGEGELCLPEAIVACVSSWALAVVREPWWMVGVCLAAFIVVWAVVFICGQPTSFFGRSWWQGGRGSSLVSWVVLWLSSAASLGWCGGGWLKK